MGHVHHVRCPAHVGWRTAACNLYTYSIHEDQLWYDTLMMTKIGKVSGCPEYIEEAKGQFMLHVKYLAHRETDLWCPGKSADTFCVLIC